MSEQIPSGDSHTAQSTHSPVSASEVAVRPFFYSMRLNPGPGCKVQMERNG